MIADCETCDRKQVPCSSCQESQRAICFICQGDIADPYCEQAEGPLSRRSKFVFALLIVGGAAVLGVYAAQLIFSGPPQHLPFGCDPKDTTASGECQ